MQISEVMTRQVECIRPGNSLIDAARKMKSLDVGVLPVCGDSDRLVGMVTDRDIVLRGVADHRDLEEVKVQDIMTKAVEYCTEDQPAEHAAKLMRQKQIRRLVVLNTDHRLVGIVSLGDLAIDTGDDDMVGHALEGISQPTAPNPELTPRDAKSAKASKSAASKSEQSSESARATKAAKS